MDNSKHLSSESFSLRWSVDIVPHFDGTDELLVDSPHEATCTELASKTKRNTIQTKPQSFNFDVPTPQPPPARVRANELFCDGLMKPISFDLPRSDAPGTLNSSPLISSPQSPLKTPCCFLKSQRRDSKETLRRFLRYSISCFGEPHSRKNSGTHKMDRKMNSCSSLPPASQEQNPPLATTQSCDLGSPIDEAILHCKRSMGAL